MPGDWNANRRGRVVQFGRTQLSLWAFAADELSARAAAELAGVDRFTFLEACEKHAIPVIDYPPEELRAEVESLRHVV